MKNNYFSKLRETPKHDFFCIISNIDVFLILCDVILVLNLMLIFKYTLWSLSHMFLTFYFDMSSVFYKMLYFIQRIVFLDSILNEKTLFIWLNFRYRDRYDVLLLKMKNDFFVFFSQHSAPMNTKLTQTQPSLCTNSHLGRVEPRRFIIFIICPGKFTLGQCMIRTRGLSICSQTRYHWANVPWLNLSVSQWNVIKWKALTYFLFWTVHMHSVLISLIKSTDHKKQKLSINTQTVL